MKDLIINIGDERFYEDTFTLGDIDKLHILKYDIDHNRKEGNYERANELYYSYINALLPHIPEKYREYIFIYKIISSDAKSVYDLQSKCKNCETENKIKMEIETNTVYPRIRLENGFILNFKYIDRDSIGVNDIFERIENLEVNGTTIPWDRLSEITKEGVISHIDEKTIEDTFIKMQVCRAKFTGIDKECCDKCETIIGEMYINDGFKIFDILINSENLMTLYQTNLELQTRGISISDQMKMKPYERSIYVNMIIRKELEENAKHENGLPKHRN